MRKLFPGHYLPTENQLKELWSEGIFVFDTNVLLSLYSYPEQAREDFFAVLNKIETRIWIPYQVAFEFHKNRFSRIQESNKALVGLNEKLKKQPIELQNEIGKIEFDRRNTGIENIETRISDFIHAYASLQEAIELVCNKLPQVSLEDPIGSKIADLFVNKIGPRPESQEALDKFYCDGDERFRKKIPPGYKDVSKVDSYLDGEYEFPAKFGDLILWRQMIEHVKSQSIKKVIFVTGDKKDDWWWSEKGGQTLGPNPQLVSEFIMKTGAEIFWMYTSDRFFEFASERLEGVNVSAESIEQVKHASDYQSYLFDDFIDSHSSKDIAPQEANLDKEMVDTSSGYDGAKLHSWLKKDYPKCHFQPLANVDMACRDPLGRYRMGYQILSTRNINSSVLFNKFSEIPKLDFEEYSLLVISNLTSIFSFIKSPNFSKEFFHQMMQLKNLDSVIFLAELPDQMVEVRKVFRDGWL